MSIETPFPVEGTITPKATGYSARLPCVTEWLTETERGDQLQAAIDRAARKYGEGVEVRVRFESNRWGEGCGDFTLLGPADEDDEQELATDGGTTVTNDLPSPEDAPSVCTTFTKDHGLDDEHVDEGEFYFGFVCPRCEETNALVGDPRDFATKPFRCVECDYIPLLDGDALAAFAEEVGVTGDDDKELVTDGGVNTREPEFDEPRDGTERANILVEELGGLPDDAPPATLESVAYLDVDADAAYSAMLVGAGEDHDFYVDGSDTPGRYVLVRMPEGESE